MELIRQYLSDFYNMFFTPSNGEKHHLRSWSEMLPFYILLIVSITVLTILQIGGLL